MENSQLIDFSCEDEFLISDSPPNFRLSVTMENMDEQKNFKKFGSDKSAAEIFDKKTEKLLLSGSNGFGRATNSRDSLAWDSAFFTSAGVLDPDELFVMNKGFERPEARKRKSTYSGYTLNTDNFFLESDQNLEADLFQDVRESIKKSKTRTNMFSEAHKQISHLSKKLDYMSQTKVKSIPTSRKQSVHKQGSERTEKGNANPLAAQVCEKNGKSKSFSPKPPKISGRENLTSAEPTRNVSCRIDNSKRQHKSTSFSFGKGLTPSQKSCLGKSSCSNSLMSCVVTPSSLSLPENGDSASYLSPFGSASSLRTFSNSRTKTSSLKSRLSESVSTFRTPLRGSLQLQNELENPNSSTHLSSFSNHSSYDSTAGTIDKCSIESPSVSYMDNIPNRVASRRKGDASAESTRGSKPSCLRMPSPKIGFFEKEHCAADFQFHVGSQSASTLIKGVKSKTRPWISTPVSSQDRGLSPSISAPHGYSQREPVISESPKLPSKPIEKESKERCRVSTILGRPRKTKSFPRQSSPLEKENLSCFEDHVDGLSKYFEGINLKSEKNMNILPNVLSKPRARMPLADKQCVCNGSGNRR